jgi:hypothetical protein
MEGERAGGRRIRERDSPIAMRREKRSSTHST